MPAASAFDKPQIIQVRSSRILGRAGDMWSGNVRIGGYARKAYERRDSRTGMIERITPADVVLDVAE
jgi:hypothetical protein